MKDQNNNNHPNDETSASDATYIQKNKFKTGSTNRTSDIYERFLNRVQSIDSEGVDTFTVDTLDSGDSGDNYQENNRHSPDESNSPNELKSTLESLDKFKKSSSFEPLDEEELRSFINHEAVLNSEASNSADIIGIITDIDINLDNDFDSDNKQHNKQDHKKREQKAKSASVDVSVSDQKNKKKVLSNELYSDGSDANIEISEIAEHVDPNHTKAEPLEETVTQEAPAQKTKSASSSKLLMIGIISGLLLSAAIMVLLNKAGFLSTSADSSKNKDLAPTSSPANTDAEPPATTPANEQPALNTQAPVAVAPQAQQEPSTTNDSPAASPQEAPTGQQGTENTTNNFQTEPPITIEDFKEEAQSTLYRETTD